MHWQLTGLVPPPPQRRVPNAQPRVWRPGGQICDGKRHQLGDCHLQSVGTGVHRDGRSRALDLQQQTAYRLQHYSATVGCGFVVGGGARAGIIENMLIHTAGGRGDF